MPMTDEALYSGDVGAMTDAELRESLELLAARLDQLAFTKGLMLERSAKVSREYSRRAFPIEIGDVVTLTGGRFHPGTKAIVRSIDHHNGLRARNGDPLKPWLSVSLPGKNGQWTRQLRRVMDQWLGKWELGPGQTDAV